MHHRADFTVLERGWLSSNSIVFYQGSRSAIVDTGYVSHAQQTLDLVHSILGTRPLELIVNTHLHSDHCGGNAALQSQHPSCKTMIPPGHAQDVRSWDVHALSFAPTGQRCERFAFHELLIPGRSILLGSADWQVHAAPGHDPESVVLFEPKSRTLISADALWESGFGVVFPELEGNGAFDAVASTLDVIDRLRPLCVIPGHGRVFYDAPKALSYARGRLEKFIREPARHAMYGVKVLMKYKLLELQHCKRSEMLHWVSETSYFSTIHQRFFTREDFNEWIDTVIGELIRSGAASLLDGVMVNQD